MQRKFDLERDAKKWYVRMFFLRRQGKLNYGNKCPGKLLGIHL